MFTAALFAIARTWKQPKYPSTDERIKNILYMYTMEYYSAIKKNERRLLRVPWTARRSNQSILKEIIPGISLEGMMLIIPNETPVLWPPHAKS